MSHLISPSFLSADFTNLEKEIKLMNNSQADWFHLDIMDGIFVPNITFGMPIISQIKKHAEKPLDVHLMIVQPERYIEDFKKAGADILTVHYEACTHLHRTIQQIKSLGMKSGVSLNPHTPVHLLENIIEEVDMVLLMSVNPGFGGQKFIKNTYDKIRQIKELTAKKYTKVQIEIDGGVDASNAKALVSTGADVLVAGSFVFNSDNPVETVSKLKTLKF
ncbi:MAG: ribulose-phosphate 3-epimerase [Bacteroidetes bacterium]|nr:MAG: ribulose-phosphate 3-epimerase [Bacteroidota bacterium]